MRPETFIVPVARLAPLFIALAGASGCGARSDLRGEATRPDETTDGGAADARRSGRDASGREAGARDAADPDAAVDHDAGSRDAAKTDATPDVGGDAPDATACDHSGEPAGTVTSIVSSMIPIIDFDVDCAGFVFATDDGAVDTCPASGCVAPFGVVAPAGAYGVHADRRALDLRIAPRGVLVLTARATDAGAVMYMQSRVTAATSVVLASTETSTGLWPCFIEGLGVGTGGGGYFQLLCQGDPGSLVLEAFTPLAEGEPYGVEDFRMGALASGDGVAVSPPNALYGGSYFVLQLATNHLGSSGPIDVFDLSGGPTDRATYLSSTAPVGVAALVASDTFVSWEGSTTDRPYVSHVYACAPDAPCASPVDVLGLTGLGLVAAYHDTLFLSDTSGGLYTCAATSLLAGACMPTLLAMLPDGVLRSTRTVIDDDNVYALVPDGSRIVRIAR